MTYGCKVNQFDTDKIKPVIGIVVYFDGDGDDIVVDLIFRTSKYNTIKQLTC